MGQAVAKVLSPEGAPRGTAFAISRNLALTAFHCIGDRVLGEISLPTVSLEFLDGTTLTASYHGGNRRLDFALLKLESSLPDALEPLPIATEADPHESFRCTGYPAAVRGADYVTIGGEVRNPAGSLFEGVPAIQLYCPEAAASASLELPGMSGGPVLVGKDPEVVVGIIRWNPQHPDGTAQAQGGMVFACPIKNVLEELPALEVHAVRRVHHKALLDTPDVSYWWGRPASLGEYFVGREDELEAITESFKEHRVVVVSGGAATGKSRLAAEYAHRSRQDGFWTTAGDDLTQTLIGLAPSLGVPVEGDDKDIINGVLRRLTKLTQNRGALDTMSPLLWVVDNLVDLDAVNELTQTVGAVNLLVTTRSARQEYLPRTATFIELQVLKPDPAIELLSSRRRRDSSWDQNDPALRDLAEEVGRLPLALEMLAVRLGGRRQTPERILDQLRNAVTPIKELEVFQETAGASIARAEGVYATILGTLGELSPEVREQISPLGYVADVPIPDPLLATLTGLTGEELERFIEECSEQSILFLMDGLVVVHKLTVAAISATNDKGILDSTLHRMDQRLLSICSDDPSAVRSELRHYERILEIARGVSDLGEGSTLHLASKLGTAYRTIGRYKDAVRLLEDTKEGMEYALQEQIKQLAMYARDPDIEGPIIFDSQQLDEDFMNILNNLAEAYRDDGRINEAIRLHTQVLTIAGDSLSQDHEFTLGARSNLAEDYRADGRINEAIELNRQVLAARERVLGPEHRTTLLSQNNLGACYLSVGRFEEAIQVYEGIIEAQIRTLGAEHVDSLRSRNNLAQAYNKTGRQYEAIQIFIEILPLIEKVLGPGHPSYLSTCHNLAGCYADIGRMQESIELYKTTLTALENAIGPDHPNTLATFDGLVAAYVSKGDSEEEIIELYQATLDKLEQVLGVGDQKTLQRRAEIFFYLVNEGKFQEAIQLTQKSWSVMKNELGPTHNSTLTTMAHLGIAYIHSGQYVEAFQLPMNIDQDESDIRNVVIPYCELLLPYVRRILGAGHHIVAEFARLLASGYYSLARYEESIKLLREALEIWDRTLGPDHPNTINISQKICEIQRILRRH